MKKYLLSICITVLYQLAFAQETTLKEEFCDHLRDILENGRRENFESIKPLLFKTVPMMDTHQPNYHLPGFAKIGIDKDQRFVAKTLLNLDSLSAIRELDTLKPYVISCLDSTKWQWHERVGDDTTTVFFREYKELYASDGIITITLAMVGVATKVYSDNMYIRRNNTHIKQ